MITQSSPKTVLMLLSNAYDPDPRVRNEALALVAMGCRVRLLAWDRDARRAPVEVMEGVEVERVFVRSTHGRGVTQCFFYALVYIKLLWRGWRIPFDVVHCHDLDTLPLGFLLGKTKRRPVIYDAHESFPDMLAGSVATVVQRSLFHLENLLIRRVDLLITVGEKLRRYFAERGARRSVVVGNWKRAREFTAAAGATRETRSFLGIPDDALVVVCITQLLPDRKLEELLGAVDETPGVHLIVGGRGVLTPMVEARARANSRIHYVGFVDAAAIAACTAAADSVYYGFDPANPNARFSAPNKLFEALAAGRPLITGDFGEIADVVRSAGCGIVLERYGVAEIRAAFETLRDPAVRRVMSGRAAECGRGGMTWEHAEEVLRREYQLLGA